MGPVLVGETKDTERLKFLRKTVNRDKKIPRLVEVDRKAPPAVVRPDEIPPGADVTPSIVVSTVSDGGRAKCSLVACGNFVDGDVSREGCAPRFVTTFPTRGKKDKATMRELEQSKRRARRSARPTLRFRLLRFVASIQGVLPVRDLRREQGSGCC